MKGIEQEDIREIKSMLEAVIQCSDEAISVVDEKGKGLIINSAYTRITGLSKEDVIGKPATTDIYEGESVHFQVLNTKRPMRGIRLKVGPNKKEVVVNAAPIIVDGILRGSVGIIRDVSEIEHLTAELQRAKQIIRTLEAKYTFDDIVGHSDSIRGAIEQGKLAAKTPVTVLLRGESGTGKELFAHAIHNASERKYNKFIRVNCAAISDTLLESELFGYEDGAFTGAKRGGKKGLFEEANKGSIFLDEIGELPLHTQAKLLRVLQEQEVLRVGGVKPIPINVRIIAATNRNLEKEIEEGNFREDLYYRLNKIPIVIPPLRHRKEDISILSYKILQKINQEYGRNIERIGEAAIQQLQDYDFPGNVRELENLLGRAVIFTAYGETVLKQIEIVSSKNSKKDRENIDVQQSGEEFLLLSDHITKLEREIIMDRLNYFKGNKTKTAQSLGLSVRNLYYKLEKMGIEINCTQ